MPKLCFTLAGSDINIQWCVCDSTEMSASVAEADCFLYGTCLTVSVIWMGGITIFKHCHEDVTVSHILSLSASLYSRLSAVSGLCVCFGQKNSMIIFGGKCRDGHCSHNGLLCAASCCTAGTSCLAISQLAEYIGYRWSWLFKYITHKVLEVYGLSSVILRARNLLLFFFRSAILFLWQLESLWALLVELNNKVAQGWCGCPIPRGI